MLADELDFVVGVDPHRDAHALAVVEVRTGVVVVESSAAADSGGYAEALRVAEQYAPGAASVRDRGRRLVRGRLGPPPRGAGGAGVRSGPAAAGGPARRAR